MIFGIRLHVISSNYDDDDDDYDDDDDDDACSQERYDCHKDIIVHYSFYWLLTNYNWLIWHNSPNHTVLETKTRFSCLHTRSNLLSVFCKTQHKNGIILHHVLIQKTQTHNITTSRITTWTQTAHLWTLRRKTDVRISGWYEQEHKWLCVKWILVVGDKEEWEERRKRKGMRSKVLIQTL